MELNLPSVLSITSSVRDDIWHPGKSPRAYEWWYFSAISDDGRDAIIVVFLDNFIFSPRHSDPTLSNGGEMVKIRAFEPKERYPAISFTFIRDRKVIYRAMNEFSEEDLQSLPGEFCCRFGESRFSFEKQEYGSGYKLSIVAPLGDGRRLQAQLEWLSIETDFSPGISGYKESGIGWNIVSPRSDVSGKIDVSEEGGKIIDSIQFRGTGMHDHVVDDHWLPLTETRFYRGAVHFADCSTIFGRFEEPSDELTESNWCLSETDQ
jgi:carotenoid 1,2-hydratase